MLGNSTELCNFSEVLSKSCDKTPHLQGCLLLWNSGLGEFIIRQLQLQVLVVDEQICREVE